MDSLVLARYLADLNERYLTQRQLLGIVALCLPPVVLIILQRDLGTAVMYVPIVGGIVLVAGLRRKVLLTVIAVALLAAPVGWLTLKDYQRQRVLVTFDPELDPQGIGYQTRHRMGLFRTGARALWPVVAAVLDWPRWDMDIRRLA